MRPQEARALFQHIRQQFPDNTKRICLNLGSSTLNFRQQRKPWIQQELMQPLTDMGFKIVHVDAKDDYGVDIVGDINQEDIRKRLKWCRPDLILCNNMLEHVQDVEQTVDNLRDIAKSDTVLAISVPFSYPYHADPIDNGFRPNPEQLSMNMGDHELLSSEVVTSDSFWHDLGANNLTRFLSLLWYPFSTLLSRPSVAWYLERLHRLAWLNKPYKVTVCLFRSNKTTNDK